MDSRSWRSSPLPPGWGQIRGYVLRRDPYCMWGFLPEDHFELGQCRQTSVEVDHMGASDDHDPSHLRGLCQDHHKVRTGRQGAAGKTATMVTRKRPPDKHPGYRLWTFPA